MIMTNEEYSDFSRNLFDKFEAGEMTAEEVYAELNKVEGVVFSGPPIIFFRFVVINPVSPLPLIIATLTLHLLIYQ